MPDRGFRNDMKQLSIVCSLCEWNGLFQGFEVRQPYFLQVTFITTGALLRKNRIFLKMFYLSDLK